LLNIMTELSLNVLDISNNSLRAGATRVEIEISADTKANTLKLRIADNGKGMSPEFLATVTDPFATTRTSRRVGMGLPLLKMEAIMTEGSFDIKSEVGKGTEVVAVFGLSHVDRPPLGDMADTMAVLIGSEFDTDYLFIFSVDGEEYRFDTLEIKEILDGVDIRSSEVIIYLTQMIRENLSNLNGGKIL